MKIKLLLLLAILTGCGNSKVERSDYLEVTGRIDEKMVAEVAKNIHKIHSLVITSQGGETSSAIELARMIYDNKVNVIVKKYCLSACAQLILPSAKTIEFVDKPILGLHHSATSILEFSKLQNYADANDLSQQLSEKEQTFFKYIGLNLDIAEEPIHYLEISCFFEKGGYPGVGSKWGFLVPSPSTYKKWINKDYTGEFASTNSEILTSVRKYIPQQVSMTLVTEEQASWRPLSAVPKCS